MADVLGKTLSLYHKSTKMKKDKPNQGEVQRTFFSSLKEMNGVSLGQLNSLPVITPDFAVAHRVRPYQFAKQWLQTGLPYQIDDYRFVLFHKAGFDLQTDLQRYHVSDGALAYVGNGSIMQFESEVPEEVQVSALLLKYDYMRYILQDRLPKTSLGPVRNALMQLDEEQFAIVEQMISTLRLLAGRRDDNRTAVEAQTAALIGYISELYVRNSQQQTSAHTRAETTFNAFIGLVNQHCVEQHQLHFYADRLCITERYLSSVVSQVSQVSAKEWIDRALITKAKVALRHSDVTSTQLADQLNFPNTAFFCKYFKRLVGCTPTEYRNGNQSTK